MTTLGAFILVLGLLIFVHELGHFLMAKRAGIKVEKFSLGFPPKLVGKKIGETEYCIGVVPLGGYVKMAGENVMEADYVPQPGDFMAASVLKRIKVVIAGPLMNYILGFLLFFVAHYATGSPEIKPGSTEVGMVSKGGPADRAGITVGSVISSIDGQTFSDFQTLAQYIKSRPSSEIVLAWTDTLGQLRTATIATSEVTVEDSAGNPKKEGRIGIGPVFIYKPIGLGEAFVRSASFTISLTGQMFAIIWRLLTRQESLKALGGPVMIAQQVGQAARQGILALVGLAAFLSVNLAILNILPIPILDGGHLVFLAVEMAKGKPVSAKGRMIAQQVGMGLLFLLMFVVTYNDIVRLIGGIFHGD